MKTTLTPAQRTLRARIGAFALHATGGTSTQAATNKFLERFTREVTDAAAARGESLTPAELHRRTQAARKAYFSKLALASSRSRAKKKATALIIDRGSPEQWTGAADPPEAA